MISFDDYRSEVRAAADRLFERRVALGEKDEGAAVAQFSDLALDAVMQLPEAFLIGSTCALMQAVCAVCGKDETDAEAEAAVKRSYTSYRKEYGNLTPQLRALLDAI